MVWRGVTASDGSRRDTWKIGRILASADEECRMKALVQDADERFIDHVQADGEKSKINTPPLLFAGTFPGGHSLHLCSKTIDGSHHGLTFTLANTIV